MALIFLYGQQVAIPGHISSVKSFNPCKGCDPRIKWMTQMALIFLYGQQVGMPGHVSSVKSFNPCKSVIQAMGVVWN